MGFRKGSSLRLLGLCLGLFLLAFTGVAGAQYTAVGGVSDANPNPGETISFTGSGFQPGSQVTVVLGNQTVRTVTADAQGNFVASVTIPCDFPAGPTTLQGTGTAAAGGTQTVTAAITVSGDPVAACVGAGAAGGLPRTDGALPRTDGGLPRTGSASTTPLVAAGVGLILIGSVAVAAARRRRSATGTV